MNNAGVGINKPFAETTEDDFDRLMNVQVKGVFFLTQKLLPLITDGGRIVNTSSGVTRLMYSAHSASTDLSCLIFGRGEKDSLELSGNKS